MSSTDYNFSLARAKAEGRCPPPRFDRILDSEAVNRAAKAREDFNRNFEELKHQKLQYLDRLNASEMYKKKSGTLLDRAPSYDRYRIKETKSSGSFAKTMNNSFFKDPLAS